MIDIKGQQFGRLTVLEFSHLDSTRHAIWKCKCDCGNETNVASRYLRNGHIKGCGCLQRRVGSDSPTWKGYGELSYTHFSRIKVDAKKRKIKFSLRPRFLWKLFEKQNRKCALSGEEINFRSTVHGKSDGTASLDRIDSTKGYTKDNVQWVHKDVNFMKQSFSMQRFQELIEKIHNKFRSGIKETRTSLTLSR